MLIFPPNFFGSSPQPAATVDPAAVLSWEIKAAPAAQLAVSSQWQKVLAAASDASGVYLAPSDIDAAGLQIAFVSNADTSQDDWDWHDMSVQERVESGIYAPAFVRVGPGAVELDGGTYQRYVRTKSTPHEVHKITTLIVEGPNP